jgi:hypothetical protein
MTRPRPLRDLVSCLSAVNLAFLSGLFGFLVCRLVRRAWSPFLTTAARAALVAVLALTVSTGDAEMLRAGTVLMVLVAAVYVLLGNDVAFRAARALGLIAAPLLPVFAATSVFQYFEAAGYAAWAAIACSGPCAVDRL